jgi:phage shock protein A
MLSHEWQELEALGRRIAKLRERAEVAQQANNVGLIESLKKELAAATRQRETLLRHISTRLTTVAVAA